jgi:hypothetical protein
MKPSIIETLSALAVVGKMSPASIPVLQLAALFKEMQVISKQWQLSSGQD